MVYISEKNLFCNDHFLSVKRMFVNYTAPSHIEDCSPLFPIEIDSHPHDTPSRRRSQSRTVSLSSNLGYIWWG